MFELCEASSMINYLHDYNAGGKKKVTQCIYLHSFLTGFTPRCYVFVVVVADTQLDDGLNNNDNNNNNTTNMITDTFTTTDNTYIVQ